MTTHNTDPEAMKMLNEYYGNWQVVNHMTKTDPRNPSEVLETMKKFREMFRTNFLKTMRSYIQLTKYAYWAEYDAVGSDSD